jgi:hypothetical protein
MRRAILILACGGLSMMPIPARADVAALFADLNGPQPSRGLARMLVIGIAEGFDTVNNEQKQAGVPALYCSPIQLNGDQLIDILRKWVDANRIRSPRIDTAPPGMALLYALQAAFPCTR